MRGSPGIVITVSGLEDGVSAEKFFENRGISKRTLKAFGVTHGIKTFSDGEKRDCVIFNYGDNRYKARSIVGREWTQSPGGVQNFYNLENVLGGSLDAVFITEGEIDALSLCEAGLPYDSILSVKGGAPSQESEEPHRNTGYQHVLDALKRGLHTVERFVLLTDNDAPGRALRADLAKLLGPAKCWYVDWPEGIKDANELLCAKGSLSSYVHAEQKIWPVEGLFALDSLPEPTAFVRWEPGFGWGDKLAFSPGTVSVVSGQPNHGKSHLMAQIWFQIAQRYSINVGIAGFETRAKPHLRRYFRSFYTNKLEKDISSDEVALADQFINNHYTFVVHPQLRPSLDWCLDTFEVAVVRHNARVVQIDPWNKLESDRGELSETDYVGVCLDKLADFARDLSCHVQIVAHPSKRGHYESRKAPPELEDIHGSKNWDNRPDLGLVIWRPAMYDEGQRQTDCELYVRKSRYEELGYPCKMDLFYDLKCGNFIAR